MAHVQEGKGLIKVNGYPLDIVEPAVLRYKIFEPVLLLGNHRFSTLDIRVRVRGGGSVSKFYGNYSLVLVNIIEFNILFSLSPLSFFLFLFLIQLFAKQFARELLHITKNVCAFLSLSTATFHTHIIIHIVHT